MQFNAEISIRTHTDTKCVWENELANPESAKIFADCACFVFRLTSNTNVSAWSEACADFVVDWFYEVKLSLCECHSRDILFHTAHDVWAINFTAWSMSELSLISHATVTCKRHSNKTSVSSNERLFTNIHGKVNSRFAPSQPMSSSKRSLFWFRDHKLFICGEGLVIRLLL